MKTGNCAYFYFDFRYVKKQFSKEAIRSLTFQIALRYDALSGLEQLYNQSNQGAFQPEEAGIQNLLRKTFDISNPISIVLDALDECTDREAMLKFVKELSGSQGVRLVVTSRRETDIENAILDRASQVINIESSLVDADIQVYVRDQVGGDTRLAKWSIEIREEIITKICSQADGMYVYHTDHALDSLTGVKVPLG